MVAGKDDQTLVPELGDKKFNVIDAFYDDYAAINNHLIKEVSTSNIRENLDEAIRWKAQLKAEDNSNDIISSLKRFINLDLIVTDRAKCSIRSQQILSENNESVDRNIHDPTVELSSLRRIESIIYTISKQHAIECQKFYWDSFSLRMNKINPETLNRVVAFLDALVDGQSKSQGVLGYIKQQFYDDSEDNEAKIAYDIFLKLADRDLEWQHMGHHFSEQYLNDNSDAIIELLKDYLTRPCRIYVYEFGPVFIPYNYDNEMLQYPLDDQPDDFKQAAARFSVCQLVVENEDALVNKVLDFIKSDEM